MCHSSKYQFEALNDDNIHHLITLYKKVFGTDYSLDFIKSKYQNDYTGIAAQGHFAFYEEKPVAFHGAIPVIMQQEGQHELCAQYGDAMTIKSHAGNGLFTILGNKTDLLLKELGVRFVWGFPNQNSEYGYVNKLQWNGNERMQCYILKLSSISKEQILRKSKIFHHSNQEGIKRKLSRLITEKKELHSVKSDHGGIDRSVDFYRYRSFTPNYIITINDTKVWIKPQGGLLIGDMEIQSEQQALNTVAALKDLGKKLGLHQLVFQASPNSDLNKILQLHYQAIDSWLIGFKNFTSSLDLSRLQFTYGDLDTF